MRIVRPDRDIGGVSMSLSRGIVRLAAAAALTLFSANGVPAQQPLKIFDAHLHYNQEPTPFYDLDKVLEIFRRNNVTGIVATSRPNKGTQQLVDAKAPGLWVVPFLRPYRTRSDIQTWFDDPGDLGPDPERIRARLLPRHRRVPHLRQDGRGEWVKKIVAFASERDLWLHAHCDEEALLILFGHDPKARIIWAHTGFSTPPARVKELLARFPGLMGELSYRGGITDGAALSADWRDTVRALLRPFPARVRHLDQ